MPSSKISRLSSHKPTVEWIGCRFVLPGYVVEDGQSYRPEGLFWMDESGMILNFATAEDGQLLSMACDSLRQTIKKPQWGSPHSPTHVRVADQQLAQVLGQGLGGISVVCAPTPETDEILPMLKQSLAGGAGEPPGYLQPGIEADAVKAFFQAAAELYHAQPWQIVPDDQSLLSVTIKDLDIHDGVISVIGQMGQSFGIILFNSLRDFDRFLSAATAMEQGKKPDLPQHLALSFDRGADLPEVRRKEIAAHQWEVASPDAYPWVGVIEEDLTTRPALARELTLFEALARAMTHLLAEKQALHAAWSGGPDLSRTYNVSTAAGELSVSLSVNLAAVALQVPPPIDPLAELADLIPERTQASDDARHYLENALLEQFADAPESKKLDGFSSCELLMDIGASYYGKTIANLDPPTLRDFVFLLVPEKAAMPPSEARPFLTELRAFYRFLKREYDLNQADACLSVLGGSAVKKLAAALTNSDFFGPSKSLVMEGATAGFDMQSKEGIQAWMRTMEGQRLPLEISLTPATQAPRRDAKKKKNQRKAARKARKKNR